MKDSGNVYGYGLPQTMAHVLRACGNDLSRENIMHQALSLDHLANPILLPGITQTTSPTNYRPLRQLQMMRWNGKTWDRFGDLIEGAKRLTPAAFAGDPFCAIASRAAALAVIASAARQPIAPEDGRRPACVFDGSPRRFAARNDIPVPSLQRNGRAKAGPASGLEEAAAARRAAAAPARLAWPGHGVRPQRRRIPPCGPASFSLSPLQGLGCEEQTKGRGRGSRPEIPAAPRGLASADAAARQPQHLGQLLGGELAPQRPQEPPGLRRGGQQRPHLGIVQQLAQFAA